ncbi:FtsX-like permease family protein [Gemmobacter lutimaris]|uniref:FtsX-like permease family protein n=1 Tax=Gemmobacter lutimaris TaxID=2306023 RepID=A0A398BKM6_9RHOB|nr:FtsX-like permease family protein [Gemmobacter lutimaris]RID90097.1 FtsX-like permease family protein [Gemmobacter lutimaris]
MGYFRLARRNAWRKPLRTVLLMLCVAIAFLIHGLTASFEQGNMAAGSASDDVLGVASAAGRGQSLPMAHLSRLAAEPGIAAVSWMTRLRGYAVRESNIVAISAVDPATMVQVSGTELGLTPVLMAALATGRDRVLVGRTLAEVQGWRVGQRITVTVPATPNKEGSRDWRFEIAGIFEGASPASDTHFVIARYDYVNALRTRGTDRVEAFVLRPAPGIKAADLARQIDALFANSAAPTRTQSEKQFLQAFMRQYADVGLIIDLVVGAAFVTLLMIVINTQMLAVRERRFEIGVLKTLGFSQGRLLALVLGETLFIFLTGGLAGLALAKLATVMIGPGLGLVLPVQTLGVALVLILGLGLATGLIPAIRAMRIPVTAAFRTR